MRLQTVSQVFVLLVSMSDTNVKSGLMFVKYYLKEEKMKRLSMLMVMIFAFGLLAGNLFAADTLELSIPLPLTGSQAKFG